jgi:hypothetical protein
MSLSLHKPTHSRIVLHRSRNRLFVEIPPAGFLLVCWGLFGYAFILFVASAFLLVAASGGWATVLVCSLPFLYMCSEMWKMLMFPALSATSLKINSQFFRLTWRCCGLKGHQQGKTVDLSVKLEVIRSTSRKFVFVNLWEGTKKQRLSLQLSDLEQEWLVSEISDFLEQLRYRQQGIAE